MRVWALNLGLLALAAPVCAALAGLPAATAGPQLPWWMLAALFALAEVCVVHFHFRRGAHSFTLAEIPLVVGLSFVAPLPVITAWAVGAGVALALGRQRPVRLVFNLASFVLAGCTAAAVLNAVAGPAAPRALVWAGVYGGVLAGSVVSVALVALAMALSGERITPRRVGTMLLAACPMAAAAASLGLAVAAVLAADRWAALTLIPVGGALLVAYRAYSAERARHKSLQLLHDASRVLGRASDAQLGLAGVLAALARDVPGRRRRGAACSAPTAPVWRSRSTGVSRRRHSTTSRWPRDTARPRTARRDRHRRVRRRRARHASAPARDRARDARASSRATPGRSASCSSPGSPSAARSSSCSRRWRSSRARCWAVTGSAVKCASSTRCGSSSSTGPSTTRSPVSRTGCCSWTACAHDAPRAAQGTAAVPLHRPRRLQADQRHARA